MIKVLVTGPIGAGKSAFTEELARLGAEVVRADDLVREVYREQPEVWQRIEAALDQGLRAADGQPDRAALARRIFHDAAARRKVEAIVHPLVAARLQLRIAASTADVFCFENAVALAAGSPFTPDEVVVVEAAAEVRRERLLARGLSRDDVAARMAVAADSKWLGAELVRNEGSREELRAVAAAMFARWQRHG